MRNIMSISLPEEFVKDIEEIVKESGFKSKSDFVKHLVIQWKRKNLQEGIERSMLEYRQGKAKLFTTVEDLLSGDDE